MGYVMGFLRSLVGSFGSEGTGAAGRPGRQLRLAVVDAAKVDGRRHLILIRCDNLEHLLMIGGPTDIVVEPNIVRATAHEPALARPHLPKQLNTRRRSLRLHQLSPHHRVRPWLRSQYLNTPRPSHRYH